MTPFSIWMLEETKRVLRYNSDNASLKNRISELSGENISLCYQCGACSSSCPLSDEMDMLPSKVIRLSQLGHESVLESMAIWICSTCFNCEVRCPRGIDVAGVMEALRQLRFRKKHTHLDLDRLSPDELTTIPQIALISSLRKLSR